MLLITPPQLVSLLSLAGAGLMFLFILIYLIFLVKIKNLTARQKVMNAYDFFFGCTIVFANCIFATSCLVDIYYTANRIAIVFLSVDLFFGVLWTQRILIPGYTKLRYAQLINYKATSLNVYVAERTKDFFKKIKQVENPESVVQMRCYDCGQMVIVESADADKFIERLHAADPTHEHRVVCNQCYNGLDGLKYRVIRATIELNNFKKEVETELKKHE